MIAMIIRDNNEKYIYCHDKEYYRKIYMEIMINH